MSGTERKPGPIDPVTNQFARPRGLAGWLAGALMARTNRAMHAAAADLLDLRPGETVLEIGFGPGTLIRLLAERTGGAVVTGVDPSDVMLRQATARNRRTVAEGRVRLFRAEVSQLPFPDDAFDKACGINSFQLWPSPVDDLREVRRVLKPGGLLLLGLRLRDPERRFTGRIGLTAEQVTDARSMIEQAGFAGVRTVAPDLGGDRAVFLLARAQT